MAGQTWLVLSLSICLCEFPCSAQRSSRFVSHGSFARGPTIRRMNDGGFRPRSGYGGFARAYSPYRFRALQTMRPLGSFQRRSEFSSRPHNVASGSSFTREPDRFSGSNVTRPFTSDSEALSAFARQHAMESPPSMSPAQRIKVTTQRADRFVPRPSPSRVAGNSSIVPRPPSGSRSISLRVPRSPVRSPAVHGSSAFAKVPQFVAPRHKVLLSSRSFSPFLPNRFVSPSPFLFSPFFSNAFFLSRPQFFSPVFSSPFLFQPPFFFSPFFSNGFVFSLSFFNPFFFQRPLFFSPFFFNPFFFQPPFFFSPVFSNGLFFSPSFSNPFFFHQPLLVSPFLPSPFASHQPFFFSTSFSNGFIIRR